MAKKYEDLAKDILENIGGAENVTFCIHCMTRLRFNVKDKGLVNEEGIRGLDVSGCLWTGDQFQIIIGSDVNQLYPVICKIGGFEAKKAIDEDADEKKEKLTWKKVPGAALKALGECITPLIPAFITYGMFASLCVILGPGGFGVIGLESGVYIVFDTVRNAFMYFIPMMIAYSSAKKFGCNPVISMLAVGVMLYPDFMALITAGTFNLFGIVPMAVTLNGQIIPVIIMCLLQSYIEKFFDKILPSSLNLSFNGVLTLLILIPVMIIILTPFGTLFGNAISGLLNDLYGFCGPLVTMVIGASWLLLIIPGMHMAVASAFMMGFFITGVDYVIMPIMFPLIFVCIAANIAILIKTKDKKMKELSTNGIATMFLGGVVEPSLYGIYLMYPKTLLACCAGMGASGLMMGLFNVGCYAFTSTNFLAITSFVAGGVPNLIKACTAIGIGMVVAFTFVIVLGIGDKKKDA